MTSRKAELFNAWTPSADMQRKLRRLGLVYLLRVRRKKTGLYEVSLVLVVKGDDPAAMLSRQKREADDEIGGITIKMDCKPDGLPSAAAVDETWLDMAKTSSSYLDLRTLQKFWD